MSLIGKVKFFISNYFFNKNENINISPISDLSESNILVNKREKKPNFSITNQDSNFVDVESSESLRGKVELEGSNNRVFFSRGVKFHCDLKIQGNGNEVSIGEECVIRGRILIKGNNQKVNVGHKSTFGSVYMLCQENSNITIGNWCMFSRDVEIRTTDAHSVVDVETNKRINIPKSISVGDHVWVGVGCLLSKGSVISSDSIVGAYAFVNGEFPESNVVLAGTPASIVKKGVTWNRGRKSRYSDEELYHWKREKQD
ncbi:MAG: acyltransferase [Neptunomonas phycophila]